MTPIMTPKPSDVRTQHSPLDDLPPGIQVLANTFVHFDTAEKFYYDVLRSTLVEGRQRMLSQAALAWVVEKSLVSLMADLTVVIGGMGVPEGFVEFNNEQESHDWLERYTFAVKSSYSTWNGLDVRGIKGEAGFYTFDLFPALEGARSLLTQETFDFITCKDLSGAKLGAVVHWEDGPPSLYRTKATEEDIAKVRVLTQRAHEDANLIYAFRAQMLEEAAPFTARVAAGVYILDRAPLAKLNKALVYDTLRLIITPAGIIGTLICTSFVDHAVFAPFHWSPEGVNTSQVWFPPESVFAVEALCSCIWRDACVVQDLWSERAQRRPVEFRTHNYQGMSKKTVVLPRRVYHHLWGTNTAEREAVEKISRAAHRVNAHYVELPDGWQAHNAAERAAEHQFPAPPPGYTFRRAHQRGGEKAEATIYRKVICRGLLTATILFGKENT